jgi:hypothetical protein
MKKLIMLVAMIFVFTVSPVLGSEISPQGLQKDIQAMITLLTGEHEQKFKQFVLTYAVFDEMSDENISGAAKSFNERMANRLLPVLEFVIGKEPLIEDDGITYIFPVPDKMNAPGNRIRFVWLKNTKHFHLHNR